MISCVTWVPKGAADPNPKRYEMSQAEMEMLERQAEMEAGLLEQEEESESEEETETVKPKKKKTTTKKNTSTDNNLPDDLRMDEYSSNDEDDEEGKEAKIGSLLVGHDSEMVGTHIGEDGVPHEQIKEEEDDDEEEEEDEEEVDMNDMNSNSDSDDEDNLSDVEDTREFIPTDIENLTSMQIGHTTGAMGSAFLGMTPNDHEDDDGSDVEDTNLTPTDALVLVSKTEEDYSSLEVNVYEQNTGNLYVHHDISLPSFPLCLAHGDINNEGGAGNYCAVGMFTPGIEVWNLDVLDALEPMCILGGEDTSRADDEMRNNMLNAMGKKGKKQQQQPKSSHKSGLREGSHTDAVMCLSWNKVHRQVIASGSADGTVKVWDITQAGKHGGGPPAATFSHHKDKVQSVAWHPKEGTLLATGSFDRTVSLVDARSNDGQHRSAKLPADCESIAWDPFREQNLTVASEDGTVTCWDVRKFGNKQDPLWSFVAHEFGGVSDVCYNPFVPGFMATCAVDKTVRFWDAHNMPQDAEDATGMPPHPCGSKEMNVGKLYSVSFYPSTPWLLGCGGSENQLSLWDLSMESAIQNRFKARVVAGADIEVSAPSEENNEDFEAMMATRDEAAEKVRNKMESNKNKKKKGKNKKKVHAKGR